MSEIRVAESVERGSVSQVSVILPCLNEADSISACVEEAQLGMRRTGLGGEVVVVDNGSVDGSADLARRAGARIVDEPVPGYGSALRAGIGAAQGDILVMADADLTYDLSRLGELTTPVAAGDADIVLGARLDGTNRGTMPFLHRFVGTPAISFLLRRACGGLGVKDSQSGFRAFDADTVRALDLKATGMEFASEMLIRASQEGLRIEETAIGYRPRVGESKLNTFTDGWRHLQLIILLAPQLVLFWPGLVMLALGLGLSLLSLLNPAGVAIGTLRWQPIFFAPILVILGTMATISGAAIAYYSSLSSSGTVRLFAFVGHPRFSVRAMATGLLVLVTGLAIDLVLFVIWATNSEPLPRGLALAGIAQSLVVSGAALAIFGLMFGILERRSGYRSHHGHVDILALPEHGDTASRRQM
jgi:glycosyltransferase involved in cell wall biosynthesis